MPTMTEPRTAQLSDELADALRYVFAYEHAEGVPPTRALTDVRGYTTALAQLDARGLVHVPHLGLGRVTLTPAGRKLARELS